MPIYAVNDEKVVIHIDWLLAQLLIYAGHGQKVVIHIRQLLARLSIYAGHAKKVGILRPHTSTNAILDGLKFHFFSIPGGNMTSSWGRLKHVLAELKPTFWEHWRGAAETESPPAGQTLNNRACFLDDACSTMQTPSKKDLIKGAIVMN